MCVLESRRDLECVCVWDESAGTGDCLKWKPIFRAMHTVDEFRSENEQVLQANCLLGTYVL